MAMADADAPLLNTPPLYRAFDAILERWIRRSLQDRPVSAEQLLESARKKAGLSDFGKPEFFDDLQILLETLREAPLTAIGRRGVYQVVHLALVRRLWLQHELERDPGLNSKLISAPFIIIG